MDLLHYDTPYSSVFDAVAWQNGRTYLQFANGNVVAYFMPEHEFHVFSQSPSLGQYYNRYIRGVFESEGETEMPKPKPQTVSTNSVQRTFVVEGTLTLQREIVADNEEDAINQFLYFYPGSEAAYVIDPSL
jgi:hypothetical protein